MIVVEDNNRHTDLLKRAPLLPRDTIDGALQAMPSKLRDWVLREASIDWCPLETLKLYEDLRWDAKNRESQDPIREAVTATIKSLRQDEQRDLARLNRRIV